MLRNIIIVALVGYIAWEHNWKIPHADISSVIPHTMITAKVSSADHGKWYKTAEEAAYHALATIKGRDVEWGGFIIRDKVRNLYTYTNSKTNNDKDHFDFGISYRDNEDIVATYHNHVKPSNPDDYIAANEVFSGDDIVDAKENNRLLFMISPSGIMREFNLSKDRVYPDGTSWGHRLPIKR